MLNIQFDVMYLISIVVVLLDLGTMPVVEYESQHVWPPMEQRGDTASRSEDDWAGQISTDKVL
jgi:hypothetical protein